MFDCMEALGLGPRQLYDVTSHGACMLRKASPFFAGLDTFAWTGSASVQCKWHPCVFHTPTHMRTLAHTHTAETLASSLLSYCWLAYPSGLSHGGCCHELLRKRLGQTISFPHDIICTVCAFVHFSLCVCEPRPTESSCSDNASHLSSDLDICCVLKTKA